MQQSATIVMAVVLIYTDTFSWTCEIQLQNNLCYCRKSLWCFFLSSFFAEWLLCSQNKATCQSFNFNCSKSVYLILFNLQTWFHPQLWGRKLLKSASLQVLRGFGMLKRCIMLWAWWAGYHRPVTCNIFHILWDEVRKDWGSWLLHHMVSVRFSKLTHMVSVRFSKLINI